MKQKVKLKKEAPRMFVEIMRVVPALLIAGLVLFLMMHTAFNAGL